MPRITIRASKDNSTTKNISEPESEAEHMLLLEIPEPPDCLGENGIFWWTYYCGLMIECGTLSRLFLGSVSNFCRLAELIDLYSDKIKEQGEFVLVPRKYQGEEYVEEQPNPLVNELRRMYDQFDRLATSLGMTPYSSKINSIDATGGTLTSPISEPPPSTLGSPPETIKLSKEA